MNPDKHFMQNLYDIGFELNAPNEKIENIKQVEDMIFFLINGASFNARLTKKGKLKKHSIRKE